MTLFTRAGCCLCDQAKAVLDAAQRRTPFELELVDIDRYPQWLTLYNEEVPVIAINGHKAFKYHVQMDEFLKKLAARA